MKKDNKGFSLVELIVVIAIMAVLMVVLTPALLRYVEKSRLQTDNSAIAEIANAAKLASASEAINNEISAQTGGVKITVTFDSATKKFTGGMTYNPNTNIDKFIAEMNQTIGTTVALKSNTYIKATNKPEITVSVDPSTMAVTVTGANIVSEVGGTGATVTY